MYKQGKNIRHLNEEPVSFRTLLMLTGGVLLIAIITFAVTMGIYNDKVSEDTAEMLKSTGIANLGNYTNSLSETESASAVIGKAINEAEKELNENNKTNNTLSNSAGSLTDSEKASSSNREVIYINKSITDNEGTTSSVQTNTNVSNEQEKSVQAEDEDNNKEDTKEKRELKFIKPVDGEIIREFAKENLVYSNTLDEWIVHLGIDVKADKTTVVKSAEDGVVETIKNDPRYGLTVIVAHDNGFKTVYSNLLTAEYVTEGESITSGQTIGTVGNNAAFEISDEPHLHFEMLRDNEKVDPKIYIRY